MTHDFYEHFFSISSSFSSSCDSDETSIRRFVTAKDFIHFVLIHFISVIQSGRFLSFYLIIRELCPLSFLVYRWVHPLRFFFFFIFVIVLFGSKFSTWFFFISYIYLLSSFSFFICSKCVCDWSLKHFFNDGYLKILAR